MTFLVSLFSSEPNHLVATGTWRVTADTPEQAFVAVKSCTSPRIWPLDSAWMVIPVVDEGKQERQLAFKGA